VDTTRRSPSARRLRGAEDGCPVRLRLSELVEGGVAGRLSGFVGTDRSAISFQKGLCYK
jgi:hypothetical protein